MCLRQYGSTITSITGSKTPQEIGAWTSSGRKEGKALSLKTKLLLLITLGIAGSVGTVSFLIDERAHEAFRKIEQERTSTLVGQFQRDFEHEGDEIIRGVETIANSDSMLRTAMELTNGADVAAFVNEAQTYAQAQRLDFLDLIAP